MKKKIVIIVLIVLAFGLFKLFGLDQYLTFEYLKENQLKFTEYYALQPIITIAIYSIIYITSTALSLPGATILTLLAGAMFGVGLGTLIVSFTSTIGATLAFLISRNLLRESIQNKYADKLKLINDGIKKEGAFYLFTLRLLPVFPFFLINLVMGLTPIKAITFFIVSQVGMLAGTIVYVNAGAQLSELESLKGILSLDLIISFSLLGLLPIVSKKTIEFIKSKKVYKNFNRPKKFDYNMVVIGAGAGGLVTSYICAAIKAKVALIEKNKMGGDCLNTGCVPSKAIIKSAKIANQVTKASEFGVSVDSVNVDFKRVMQRVHEIIKKIEPHDSIERYSSLGVECITDKAQILSPWEVKVGDRVLKTKNITIATGASPFVPPIKGLGSIEYLTSENLWNLTELPKKMVVLGAGPIGLEMAQSFQRLGSKVVVVEMGPAIMSIEDKDVSEFILEKLSSEGVDIKLNHTATEFVVDGEIKSLIATHKGENVSIEFDQVLIAVGRRANIKGFGLESLNLSISDRGTIQVDEFMRTNYPNIFACGDVAGPYQLTHMAAHQAWYCAVNGLFGRFKKFRVDYSVVPWCTYTDPEVATVGKNEKALSEQGIEYDVTKYGIDDLDRAICDSNDSGFVKVLTQKNSDKILGATIVGVGASDMLLEFISAMKNNKGLNSILGTIHPYPTMGEANKFSAGEWKKANAPEKLLDFVKRFHVWSRS